MSVFTLPQEAPRGRLNVSKERFKEGEGRVIAQVYFASKAAVRINAGETCHCPPEYACELCSGDPRSCLTPENILAALEPLMRVVDEAHIEAEQRRKDNAALKRVNEHLVAGLQRLGALRVGKYTGQLHCAVFALLNPGKSYADHLRNAALASQEASNG